jgi:hypothetical protein
VTVGVCWCSDVATGVVVVSVRHRPVVVVVAVRT